MGLSAEEVRKSFAERGLFETLVTLREAFGNNNQELAKIFPNIRALRGIFDLMGPQLESNRDLINQMADSTGVLDEAFAAQANTVGFKWRQAWAEFKVTIIETGEVMAPFAVMAAGAVRSLLGWFDRLGDTGKKVAVGVLLMGPPLLAVAAAAKVASVAIGVFVGVTKTAAAAQGLFKAAALGTRLGLLAIAVQAKLTAAATVLASGAQTALTAAYVYGSGAVAAFGSLALGTRIALLAQAAATKVAAAAQWLFNAAVSAFPVILIIAAVAAAVAAIWYFRDEIWGFLQAAWSKITGVFAAIGRFFADLGGVFYDAGRSLIQALVDGIVSLAKLPYQALEKAFGFVGDLLPFSDAKEGPLSRLTESGRRIGATLAAGVDESGGLDLAAAVARILPDPLSLTAPLPVGPIPTGAGAGGRGRGPVNITLNIDRVEITAAGADAAEVAAEFVGEVQRMVRSVAEEFDSEIDA